MGANAPSPSQKMDNRLSPWIVEGEVLSIVRVIPEWTKQQWNHKALCPERARSRLAKRRKPLSIPEIDGFHSPIPAFLIEASIVTN